MSRTVTLSPSCRLCRREGEKLFLKGDRCHTTKCAIVKRKYAPGAHGIKQSPRMSEYGLQLRSKQKAKRLYGVMEKQFRNYYSAAMKQKEASEITLKQLLEMRLDNVVYRLGLASSRAQARQAVSHAHILVNGKKLNIPSYQVKVGDEISVREKTKTSKLYNTVSEKMQQSLLPSWLSFDQKELKGKVLGRPSLQDVQATIDAKLIIEYYSRF